MLITWRQTRLVLFLAVALLFGAATLASSTAVEAARGGMERPLKGQFEARFSPPGVIGSGIMSHMGRIQVVGEFPFQPRPAFESLPWPDECLVVLTIDPLPAGTPSPISTWVAANGDELHHTNLTGPENWTHCVRADGTGVVNANYEIVGGTGRFTDATGSYSAEFFLPEVTPGVPPERLIAEVLGTVNY